MQENWNEQDTEVVVGKSKSVLIFNLVKSKESCFSDDLLLERKGKSRSPPLAIQLSSLSVDLNLESGTRGISNEIAKAT